MNFSSNFVSYIKFSVYLVLVALGLVGCNPEHNYEEPPRVVQMQQSYHFYSDIKPILDQKCIACHACNDALCQLKLEAAEGVDRGGSSLIEYNSFTN